MANKRRYTSAIRSGCYEAHLVDILERGIPTPFPKGGKRGVGRRRKRIRVTVDFDGVVEVFK